jgi:uroporphyrinogen decarboxylase
MAVVADALEDYLTAQIRAGVQAVQMFDSWVGALSPADYREYVFPYSSQVLRAAEAEDVPVIHFGTGTATLLELMKAAGGTVIGLDWRVPLDQGWKLLGEDVAVQGNLEPAALLAPPEVLKRKIQEVLDQAGGRQGHIFNLGHGIHKETDPGQVKLAVELVHELSAKE